MIERRDFPKRDAWPWWKRGPITLGRWVFNVVVGPFLTKLPDRTVQGSMTRIAVAAFTVVEVYRLMPQPGPGALRIVPVIGWADAFLAFCVLFALPIDNALAKAKPAEVLELLGKPFAGASSAVEQGAQVTTTLQQEVTPAPEAVPATNPAAEFEPHEWADGEADEGDL